MNSADIQWFLSLLDPSKLDIKSFELGKYLKPFLESVGNRFKIKAIILRKRDENDVLQPIAWYGVEGEKVKRTFVTMEKPLVSHLAETKVEYLIKDLKENPKYGQSEFAGVEGLKDGYAFPILRKKDSEEKFDGFIIYCTKDPDTITQDLERVIKLVNKFIKNTFLFADRVNEIYQEFEAIDDVYRFENGARDLAARKEFKTSAKHFRAAARQSLSLNNFEKAGDCFFNAAEEMKMIADAKSTFFRIDNYAESALAYAQRANKDKSRKSYEQFKTLVDEKVNETETYTPKDEFFFNKLINALDANGLDDFAGKVYVDKMNIKLESYNRQHARLRAFMYQIWKITSHYGENVRRFLVATIGVISFFAIAYFPTPWGWGFVELKEDGQFLYTDWTFWPIPSWSFWPISSWTIWDLWPNVVSSFSFSVTVFSTLGFGNITPANFWAHLFVVAEVLCGWAFLGIFVTLVGRKFLRKIY